MPLDKNINTLEKKKFTLDADGKTSHRTQKAARRFNTFNAAKTSVGTSATKINVPEDCTDFVLYHIETGETLWLGNSDTITTASTGIAPIPANFQVAMELIKGNDNNLYGVVSAGTIDVYAIGWSRQ